MDEEKPTIVHASTSVFVKYKNEYIYISEEKKIFSILDEYPWFINELINELAVAFADTANKTAQNFHKTGRLDMGPLGVYINVLTAYSESINTNYTNHKIKQSMLLKEKT